VQPNNPYKSDGDEVYRQLSNIMMKDVIQNHFLFNVSEASIFNAVMHTGSVRLDSKENISVRALFDTGATHASYINSKFYEEYKNLLSSYVHRVNHTVYMADSKTQHQIDKKIVIPVEFRSKVSGKLHCGKVEFFVMPLGLSKDMIIGIPDIIKMFGAFFVENVQAAIKEQEYVTTKPISQDSNSPIIQNISGQFFECQDGELKKPWSNVTASEEAPEDAAVPLPCSFTEALHFMEMTVEDARAEYFKLFDSHFHPEFAKQK